MSPLRLKPFLFQRVIRWGLLSVLIIFAIAYATWQARFLINGPQVSMADNLDTVQTNRVISVEGRAENVTSLYLNGHPITIDESGAFVVSVVLENGYSIVSVDAKDRYGRTTHWEKDFVYKESTEVAQN